jgi:hypothetical protein
VARVRLLTENKIPHTVAGHSIGLERILVWAKVFGPSSGVLLELIVDTGANLTVFPERAWKRFPNDIRWLTRQEEKALPKWCWQFSGVAGGTVPSRLGTVGIELVDHRGGSCGPYDILALFAQDGGAMLRPLFGLGGGALRNLRQEFTHDTASGFLEELTARRP